MQSCRHIVLKVAAGLRYDLPESRLQPSLLLTEMPGSNYLSIFNYKAMGFTCEAVLRNDMARFDGKGRMDVFIFGLLCDEWQAMQSTSQSDSWRRFAG